MTLRYFATAAEAARCPEECLSLPAGATLAAPREQLSGRDLEMVWVIPIYSLLVNLVSIPADSLAPLTDSDAVDVFPSFAGG